MRCPACGREMFIRGTQFECPNILCDYEEEIGDNNSGCDFRDAWALDGMSSAGT